MGEGKDILEFPLEEMSIPQSIALMMQAATTTVGFNHEVTIADFEKGGIKIPVDNERLSSLAEKLEARVEDELEKAQGVRDIPVEEDNPNEPTYSDVDGHKVTLVHEYVEFAQDNVITKVVVDDVVFALLCNEPVSTNVEGERTKCIKQWGHEQTSGLPECEDAEGNRR